ncbi:unnamed protein product [Lampetra fluviatilis]
MAPTMGMWNCGKMSDAPHLSGVSSRASDFHSRSSRGHGAPPLNHTLIISSVATAAAAVFTLAPSSLAAAAYRSPLRVARTTGSSPALIESSGNVGHGAGDGKEVGPSTQSHVARAAWGHGARGKAGPGRARPGQAGPGRARPGKAGQGRARPGTAPNGSWK